jgi:hypothetical protein
MKTFTQTWTRNAAAAALSAVVVLVGCEKKSEPAKNPKPPTPEVTPKAGTGASAGAGHTTGGGPSPLKSPTTMPTTGKSHGPTTEPDIASIPPDKSAAQMKKAQGLLDQAAKAIKDERFEDARARLDEVDAMKDSLPKQIQDSVAQLRKNLANIDKLKVVEPPPEVEGNK